MRYAQIRNLDISNGEGVGISLFVQGCRFFCNGCFNKETWDFNGGKEWTEEVENKFLELASRPYIKRISILGGEPLAKENVHDVMILIHKIRTLYPEKKIWLYTGYTWENATLEFGEIVHSHNGERHSRHCVVEMCDVLVDGQFVESQKDITLKFRGSSNQRLIDVQQTLDKGEVVLWEIE
jgi:anaerobic ribonucleoside-triphosphate reductase activating protein